MAMPPCGCPLQGEENIFARNQVGVEKFAQEMRIMPA
jgi:hypothetical protein